MARPNRIPEKAAERNVSPDEMVLSALRAHKTIVGAADSIGISFQSLWDYINPLQDDGTRKPRFKKICHWMPFDTIDAEIVQE